jgi:hypothetical protein
MHIENQKINQIKELCKQHKVKTLFAFGSVTRDDFKADSDIDLVVDFDEKDPFIYWDGWVNKNTAAYKGTFSFGKLPIQVVLTEETRGLWKSRIIGPDWLKVDSMSVKSLPPTEYAVVKPKNLQWLVGGSYVYNLNNSSSGIGVNFGLNLFDRHNLILGATTLNQVSLGYTYKIKTFKRNK